MFGKPNQITADVMLAEVDFMLPATATALEAEHPDPTATDAQGLVAWIVEAIGHVILEYGRSETEAFRTTYTVLALMRFRRPQGDQWEEPLYIAGADRLKTALARHVRGDRPRLSEAAAEYYQWLASLEPPPALSAEQFARLAATALSASMTRLQNAGYIKVR